MMENKETTRKIEDEKAQGMGRGAFLASLFGAPVAVRALDLPMVDKPANSPVLLAFETPTFLSPSQVSRIHGELKPIGERHGFESLILHSGMTVKRVS